MRRSYAWALGMGKKFITDYFLVGAIHHSLFLNWCVTVVVCPINFEG